MYEPRVLLSWYVFQGTSKSPGLGLVFWSISAELMAAKLLLYHIKAKGTLFINGIKLFVSSCASYILLLKLTHVMLYLTTIYSFGGFCEASFT